MCNILLVTVWCNIMYMVSVRQGNSKHSHVQVYLLFLKLQNSLAKGNENMQQKFADGT